nr:reverse transcriptase domain-containing protein [Tanacetum cinerariifolium]
MSTRSSARNFFPPFDNPELTLRRRYHVDPTLSNDFEMATEGKGDPPLPDLWTMEELCQPSLNGRGGPIAPIAIQAPDFGLKNNIKVNGVIDDALRLNILPYSLTHHATAWFDRLPRNSINTFELMVKMFLGKYFPPSMVTNLRNEITNFRQRPDESQFKAWERYKLSIDRCPNHNMLPVTQIDTFYNGLTLRHRDTINAAAGGTFMKIRPEECYDLIENMIATTMIWILQPNELSHLPSLAKPKTYMLREPIKVMNTASSSGLGTLPSNTITNPKEDLKGITTGRGTAYQGPTIPITSSSLSKVVELKTPIPNSKPVVAPIIEPVAAPVSAPKPSHKPSIPYPSRLHDQKLIDKANDQKDKFFQIFKDLDFNISFAYAVILMPKFGPTIKSLLTNKDKLYELARTSLNEHCLTVLLKKFLEKLGDPGKFLIMCDFLKLDECLALADLGASINLMPLSVWNKLSFPKLTPTLMTLKLADRLISRPIGVAKDVFVKVAKFHFSADFEVVDFDADPRVPLIIGRSFVKTIKALINVYERELTLREYSQEVLGLSDVIVSGNPTPYYDPIISTSSPTLTPFGDSDFLLEGVDAFLDLKDDSTSPEVDHSYFDTGGTFFFLKHFLMIVSPGSESRPPMPNKENYVPWSSHLLRYAKSRPNGKLIQNSILNGPYVRKMVPEPGDANRDITITKTFHLQTDDELSDKELKQIEADDQAIQTILFGLPKDIYATVDSCETAQEIWLRVQQMMKGSDIGIQEKKAKLFNELEREDCQQSEVFEQFTARYNQKEVDELKAERLAKTQDPLALMANSNNPYAFPAPHQDQSSFNQNYLQQPMLNPEDIIDPTTAMNMALALMAKAFKLNYSTPTNNNQRISSNPRNRQIAQPGMNMGQDRQMHMVKGNGGNQFRQYAGNPARYNEVIGNQNQIRNGNLVAAHAKRNAAGQNGNQIRCYNCMGIDSAPVYDTDGSAEVHENSNDNEIFNLVTQEELYTELLEPIPESHQKMALGYQNPFYLKQAQKKQQSLYDGKLLLEKHDPLVVHDSEETLQLAQESRDKMKQMNKEIKPANYTKINHLLGIFVHQKALSREELYFSKNSKTANVSKSFLIPNEDLSNDTTPSVACKFLNEEADDSLAKHKALELEIERLLKAVNALKTVSSKRKLNLLNFGMIGTRNPLSQKLENENVELEFQVLNYARENAHLKATYKNLFDSISVSRTQTKTIIASLQNELQSNIYKNNKLRTQLFKKVSDQKDNTQNMSANTKFAKQLIVENLPKVGKTNVLSNPVTSNSVSTPQESKGVNNDKVIAPGMFRINPSKTSREEKHVPNTVSESARTKPITISQPHVITKKDVNSDLNGLSSTGIDNTKTRRPQPRSNTKNDRVPSASKSSRSQNKQAEVEEHHRNLLLSKNNKHISSVCNNIKIDSQDVISKVFCAMCKKCLIFVNHDKCLSKNVNGENSCGKNQKAKVSVKEIQKKYQPKVTKPNKVEHHECLATPKPIKPRFLLRWSPTGRLFDQQGKLADSSNSESQYDCSYGDNAMEPKIKRKMIPEPGDANRDITVTKTFHLQTDDELSDKELKQIEADDQAIQTILLGLPEDIYAAVDSCETAQEIWLQV